MEENNKKENLTFAQGLFEFLKEYSVIGLAIGVIVAQVSKDLIDSIVIGIFTPLIQLMTPGEGFESLTFSVNGAFFNLGVIVRALLTFLIVMVILYVLVKKILKKDNLLKK